MTGYDLIALTRVSTKAQAGDDRYGLPAQRKTIQQTAKAGGHRIVRWLSDDGISGALDETGRPGLFAALRAVQNGEAEGVIFPELGRLARELHVQEAILGQIWNLGGRAFDYTGEILADDPDDPMRTAMRRMAGVFNELERAMIKRRMRNGRNAKREAGGYADGSPRFGTRREKPKGHASRLVPDEAEAAVVAVITGMRAEGMGIRQITAELNERGIPAKRGGPWHPPTVARVLRRAEAADG